VQLIQKQIHINRKSSFRTCRWNPFSPLFLLCQFLDSMKRRNPSTHALSTKCNHNYQMPKTTSVNIINQTKPSSNCKSTFFSLLLKVLHSIGAYHGKQNKQPSKATTIPNLLNNSVYLQISLKKYRAKSHPYSKSRKKFLRSLFNRL